MIGVAMIVGFSFQGTELIGIPSWWIRKPGEEYSARGASGVLAYPAVLCVRDLIISHHSVYRPKPAA
ncbi:hypothetical protein ACVXG7_29015 [Enterobacter hormaechei]